MEAILSIVIESVLFDRVLEETRTYLVFFVRGKRKLRVGLQRRDPAFWFCYKRHSTDEEMTTIIWPLDSVHGISAGDLTVRVAQFQKLGNVILLTLE